nr:translation initiation factor IF-2-like [Gorilla gorilla gorilla]
MVASLQLLLFFFLMRISNRGKGTGEIRLSSQKSQIPAAFLSPAPGRCAPGTPGEVGTLRRSERARVPASPAPRPLLLPGPRPLPPLRRRLPRSLSISRLLSLPLALPRSPLLFRAFLAAPRLGRWVRAPWAGRCPLGGARGGTSGRDVGAGRGAGGGAEHRGQSPPAAQSETKGWRARGRAATAEEQCVEPGASDPRQGREGPGAGVQSGCTGRLHRFGKVRLILHAFLRAWSPALAPSQ